MNAEQYRAVIGWFNARPAAKKALRLVSRSAVAQNGRISAAEAETASIRRAVMNR